MYVIGSEQNNLDVLFCLIIILILFFIGEYYYRLNDQGIDTGYPRVISWDWGNIEGPIDAALTWPNGWTFIFKVQLHLFDVNLLAIYIKVCE